jgi:hypothetical protein
LSHAKNAPTRKSLPPFRNRNNPPYAFPIFLILSFLSFCFLFFDGNDKYYRPDNNQPDARGQYYDDFSHLSKRRLVPFGIFRRAKEKREIAVGQFFKTRLVNPAVLCEVDGFPRYANR